MFLCISGALLFNNWVLGFLLNSRLFRDDGSISELSATNQPYAWDFRSLDIAAGVIFVLVAIWWIQHRSRKEVAVNILFYSCLILGIADIADALLPLNCSETLSPSCSVPINVSLHHLILPSHAYSSVAVGVGYFLLPLGGWLHASLYKSKEFLFVSRITLILTLILFGTVIYEYAHQGVTVRASGISQGVQMLAFGAWFISWGYSAVKLARG